MREPLENGAAPLRAAEPAVDLRFGQRGAGVSGRSNRRRQVSRARRLHAGPRRRPLALQSFAATRWPVRRGAGA